MKRTVITLLISLITICTSLTFAQMHHGPKGKKDKGPMKGEMMKGEMKGMCGMRGMGCMPLMMLENDQHLKKIGVQDKERVSIRETVHKMKKDMMDIHFQIKEAHIALRGEYAKGALDESKIDELNGTISRLHKSKIDLILATGKSVMKMLTPEQRAKMSEPKKRPMGKKDKGPIEDDDFNMD